MAWFAASPLYVGNRQDQLRVFGLIQLHSLIESEVEPVLARISAGGEEAVFDRGECIAERAGEGWLLDFNLVTHLFADGLLDIEVFVETADGVCHALPSRLLQVVNDTPLAREQAQVPPHDVAPIQPRMMDGLPFTYRKGRVHAGFAGIGPEGGDAALPSFGCMPDVEAVMPDPISLVLSPTVIHRAGEVPIFKVKGFDGYDFAARGVTDQFLDNAAVYFEKYTNPAHFRELYSLGLQAIDLPDKVLSVLDIGTGGGNSIFAVFDILGKDRIRAIGVDISPQLLELCGQIAQRDYALDGGGLSLLCADLYDLDVQAGSVDLVTGSSILHHMLDPRPIVELAVRALKPGGSAIFAEPFEDGHGVMRMAYAIIIEVAEMLGHTLPEDFLTFVSEFSLDFDARRGIGEVRDYTQNLDDKWFFTRSWFQDLAHALDCDIKIIPTHGGDDIFWNQTVAQARLHNGADANELPEWAQAIVKRADESFSMTQKRDLAFTAVVTFTRR